MVVRILPVIVIFHGLTTCYTAEANLWPPLGPKLSGNQISEAFGYSVSLNGNGSIMAVGAPYYDEGGVNNIGRVQVYRLDMSTITWSEMGHSIFGSTYDISGSTYGRAFGSSVTLSEDGTSLAVSGHRSHTDSNIADMIYIWQANTNTWDSINFTPPCSCYFASSAVSGDGTRYATVGGILGDYSTDVAYVFSSSSRVNVSDVFVPTGYHSWYGNKAIALSADGTRVALGGQTGTGWGSNGFVRVFEESGGNWSQIGGDINTESGEHYASFGTALAFSADGMRLIVGAPGVVEPSGYSYTGGSGAGVGAEPYAVVYQYDVATGIWVKMGGVLAMGQSPSSFGNGNYYHFFGKGVSISSDGSLIAVGVDNFHPYNGGANGGPGFARIYKWDSTITSSWIREEDFLGNSTAESAGKDVSLCGDGTVLAMGKSHQTYSSSLSETGCVTVYGTPEVASEVIPVNSANTVNTTNVTSPSTSNTTAVPLPPPSTSNATAVPPPPPSPSPPPPPKSLVFLADYESSAGRVSVLTAFVVILLRAL